MEKKFKPFDKVLVRQNVSKRVFNFMSEWSCALYSHYSGERNCHIVIIGGINRGFNDSEILPCEGNEHLVGSDQNPEEEIRLEVGDFIMVSDFIDGMIKGCCSSGFFIRIEGESFLKKSFSCNELSFKYAIRFKDFNPQDMEETSRHILCVKNGKIVRYSPE